MDFGLDDGPSAPSIDLDDAPPLPPTTSVRGSKIPPEGKGKKGGVKKKGGSTLTLWVLLLLFLLVAVTGAVYVFQDTMIKYWPVTEEYLIQAHFRHERPGAGFELKRLGEIERGVRDNVEVVVIRGIIINVSNRTRPVPPLKLVLLDKDGHPLQEKIDKSPVASLDPAGTSSFKIQLERPDANARTINLEFVELPEPAVGETEPHENAGHEGIMTPPAPPAPAPATPMVPPPAMTAPAAAPHAAAPEHAHPAETHKEK